MRGIALNRANMAAKVKRAVKILLRHGYGDLPETQPANHSLAVKSRKFARSHFGCACWMCANPRRFWRGKSKDSLPFSEYRQLQFHKHDHTSEE